MRLVRFTALVLLGFVSCVAAQAQLQNCNGSTKLACLVPFTTSAGAQASQATIFNGPIGVQISQLPVAASAPGATVLIVNGNPQAFDNLGPILLDRPDSVGRHKLVIGFSFQAFNFNHLDGIGIGSIPFVFSAEVNNPDGPGVAQTNYFQQNVHVSLKYDQYVALATYGLTKTTDISFIVPFARVSTSAYNLNSYEYQVNSANLLTSAFQVNGLHGAGSASGISDLQVNVKHVLYSGGEAGKTSVATGAAFRFPTGDALNYLGSGAYGFNLYALASYKAMFSPHAKVAYQWNTSSELINSGGANQQLPGGAQYGVGVDIGVTHELTASVDLLANEFQNSPSISLSQQELPLSSINPPQSTLPACPTNSNTSPIPACNLQTIAIAKYTYTTANLSVGIKLKPFHHKPFIFYGNALVQLNDVGLRSDVSPSVGLSYQFF